MKCRQTPHNRSRLLCTASGQSGTRQHDPGKLITHKRFKLPAKKRVHIRDKCVIVPGLDLLPAGKNMAVPEIKDPVADPVDPLSGIPRTGTSFSTSPSRIMESRYGYTWRVSRPQNWAMAVEDVFPSASAWRIDWYTLSCPELLREDKIRFVVKVPVPVEKFKFEKCIAGIVCAGLEQVFRYAANRQVHFEGIAEREMKKLPCIGEPERRKQYVPGPAAVERGGGRKGEIAHKREYRAGEENAPVGSAETPVPGFLERRKDGRIVFDQVREFIDDKVRPFSRAAFVRDR